MRYLHPTQKLYDPEGQLASRLVKKDAGRTPRLPPKELGRLGGEMARRMVEAALTYLTERSVAETRLSFVAAAFGRQRSELPRRSPLPGQKHKISRIAEQDRQG